MIRVSTQKIGSLVSWDQDSSPFHHGVIVVARCNYIAVWDQDGSTEHPRVASFYLQNDGYFHLKTEPPQKVIHCLKNRKIPTSDVAICDV